MITGALPRDTTRRLIDAASALFAERGYHATTMRDIAARARVNLASGHYHYGSKRALYLEVLRLQFAETRALLVRRGASKPLEALPHLSPAELTDLLQARVQAMLDLLIGPPPGLHGTLMQREMTDPSEALPVIVDEFISPMLHEMESIVSHLAPTLDKHAVPRVVRSIMGQVLFYRLTRPALLHLLRRAEYARGTTRELAAHITQFSLGGLERLTASPRRRRHAS